MRNCCGELKDVTLAAGDGHRSEFLGDGFRLFFLAGTGQQDDRISAVHQALGELAISLVAPMLRFSVESTGMQAEDRPVEADTEGAQPLASFFTDVNRQPESRNLIDHSRSVHRCQKGRVIVELVTTVAVATDAVGQKQTARIGRISPALADARCVGDHRRAE